MLKIATKFSVSSSRELNSPPRQKSKIHSRTSKFIKFKIEFLESINKKTNFFPRPRPDFHGFDEFSIFFKVHLQQACGTPVENHCGLSIHNGECERAPSAHFYAMECNKKTDRMLINERADGTLGVHYPFPFLFSFVQFHFSSEGIRNERFMDAV